MTINFSLERRSHMHDTQLWVILRESMAFDDLRRLPTSGHSPWIACGLRPRRTVVEASDWIVDVNRSSQLGNSTTFNAIQTASESSSSVHNTKSDYVFTDQGLFTHAAPATR